MCQHRVKNIAYFSLIVWSLLCLLASDFPSENPRTQTRNETIAKHVVANLRKMKNTLIIILLIFTNFLSGQNNMSEKVSESFNIDNRDKLDSIAKQLNYKGGDQIKVLTIFTIDEEGNVVDIQARSVHPLFEKEAIRVLSELPKMPPAKHNGKAISQKYSMPIVFEIETESAKKQRLKKEKRKREKELKNEKN